MFSLEKKNIQHALFIHIQRAFTLQAVVEALSSMENSKATGIDGLPVEFYESCWSILANDLLEVLNYSVARVKLPISCHRAVLDVLTLLPKKGDLYEIENWRSVCFCTDCKIFSKVLACRLRKVIDQVIHDDQSYCIPGRSIRCSISSIRDYYAISNLLDVNFGLISRVEHLSLEYLEGFWFLFWFHSHD